MEQKDKDLEIQTPCHMRWAELKGDGAKRWCDQCALHVVDGASLTKSEAKELVSEAEERVCMRIVRDENGRAIHADDASRSGVVGRVLRYGLTAAAGMLVACGDDAKDPEQGTPADPDGSHVDPHGGDVPKLPPEIMGEVCFPENNVEELGDVVCQEEVMGIVAPEPPPEVKEPREIMGRVAYVPEEHVPETLPEAPRENVTGEGPEGEPREESQLGPDR